MPKPLSDPAWLAFQTQIDLEALALPPWGAVIHWGQSLILVYICPGSGTLCQKGEVLLTDITDLPQIVGSIPGTYDTSQGLWWYRVPQELMQTIAHDAADVLEATGKVIQVTSQTVGDAAGALTAPLLQNLALPLIVVGLAFLMFEFHK